MIATNVSSQVPSEIFCPPAQIWVLGETTTFKVTAAVTIVMCPVTILLNVLVIIAVKLRSELKKNKSNVLFASMAIADVLVGAVSMPLTITLDVLVLVKFLSSPGTFCSIAFVNDVVLYIGSCSSVYHLTVIAWERYVAIRKWMDYKVIVTRERVKKYAIIAWILAVLAPIPPSIMKIVDVHYKYVLVIDIVCVIPGAACMILLGYFYIQVYLGVRGREIEKIREVRSLIKAKGAKNVAKRTAMLTAVVLISFVPSLVFLLFGEVFPALRRSSFFRWSMMLAQLHPLLNPVLYCYRNPRFRAAMLEMLKMKKPSPRAQRNIRRNGSVQSLEDVPQIERVLRSYNSLTNLRGTAPQRSEGDVVRQRRMSAPSHHASHRVISVDIHQPKIPKTEPRIQVESGATKKAGSQSCLEDTSDQPQASRLQNSPQPQAGSSVQPVQESRCNGRETIRSKSLDEHALVGVIDSQHKRQTGDNAKTEVITTNIVKTQGDDVSL